MLIKNKITTIRLSWTTIADAHYLHKGMGVFSKWSILAKVEERLDSQVLHNPNFPFVEEEHSSSLVYRDRPPEFYISCG